MVLHIFSDLPSSPGVVFFNSFLHKFVKYHQLLLGWICVVLMVLISMFAFLAFGTIVTIMLSGSLHYTSFHAFRVSSLEYP